MTHLDYKKNSSFDVVRLPSYEWGSIFFKKSACISLHVPIDLCKEFSQSLALSFRENGNNLSRMVSSVHVLSIKVLHTSSKSLICMYVWIFRIHTVKCRKKLNHARFQIESLLVKRQDNTRRCTLSGRVKILPKSSKFRLIIELWRSITLNTPFTLYIFNISHDKKNIYI